MPEARYTGPAVVLALVHSLLVEYLQARLSPTEVAKVTHQQCAVQSLLVCKGKLAYPISQRLMNCLQNKIASYERLKSLYNERDEKCLTRSALEHQGIVKTKACFIYTYNV